MKKFLKIASIVLASILVFLYVCILIAPPIVNKVVDFEKYKKDIQKIVYDNSKLNLNYSDIKLYSTPMLSTGVIIKDIEVTFDDKSTLFKTSQVKGGIALLNLFLLNIKSANCYVENPFVNLEIVDGAQYKIVKIIEDLININNAKAATKPKDENETPKIVQKMINHITISIPEVVINNLELKVLDLQSGNNLKAVSDKVILGYKSKNNSIKIKSNAKLLSNDKENILANVDFRAILPKIEQQKETPDPDEKIELPFINIVKIYQTYDLKTNIDTKLRLRPTKNNKLIAFGYLNIDNLNLKLSEIRLPDSYAHLIFDGRKITYDSDIYAHENEKLNLNGVLKYGKHPKLKTTILANEIHFNNVLNLLIGLMDSLNIKNDLDKITTTGYLKADATIKTDFKKIKSSGSIIIKDGSFINPKTNIGIKNIIANLVLDNDILDIKNTSAVINNSKLNAEGKIDNQSNVDIKINVDDLSLSELYQTFAPKDIKSAYKLNRANLSAHINLKGKIDNLNANLNTKLKNLSLSDAKNTIFVTNDLANINFLANSEQIKGQISNNGFKINIPQMKTQGLIDKLSVDINNTDILINPFDFKYNDLSKITINGKIENYINDPDIDIFLNGNISTNNLIQTLGREIEPFVSHKGIIQLKTSISGTAKEQNIIAQIYCDKDNFITPIDFVTLLNSASLMNLSANIKNGKIKVKDSGLFKLNTQGFSDNLTQNTINAQNIIDLTTIIDNNHINLFRLTFKNPQELKLSAFKKSSMNAKGKVILNGRFDNLNYGGDLKIANLTIPELLFKTQNLDLGFYLNGLSLKTKQIDLNGSKIDASLKADLNNLSLIKLNDIDVKSDLIDVDKTLKVLDELNKYLPAPQKQTTKTTQAVQANIPTQNIPIIANGKFDIKALKTGNINISNIKGLLALENNTLLIHNLDCNAFKGEVQGDIKMNILNGLLGIKLKGKDLDSNMALTDAANMKDMISGDLKFKTDITLKGATYLEQMKSLKGKVDFELKQGVYGPFSKLENFFLAENIRENPVFKNTIGIILTPLATIDSSHYEKLTGSVNFNNGIVHLNDIKSQGDILCVLINGNMDLIKNDIDSNVRVRLASSVSDMLGPIAMANPVNLVKNTPGLNIASAKLFSIFSQVVTPKEYEQIPDFSKSHSDDYATKFQIVLKGDVAKPLSLVKSFKWLVLQEDMDKAKEFSEKYVQEQEQLLKQQLIDSLQKEYEDNNKLKVGVEKLLQMDTTAPKVKEMLVEETIKTQQENLKNKQQEIKEEVKQSVQQKSDEINYKINEKINEKVNEANAKKQELIEQNQKKQQELKELQEKKVQEAKDKLKQKLEQKLAPAQKAMDAQAQEQTQAQEQVQN